MPNPNHPKKGSIIKVQPITSLEDIEKIKGILYYKPMDLCLFTLGINTNLRASDLLRIRVGMVRYLKPMDELVLREQKTGKERRINLNKPCIEAIGRLLASKPLKDTDYLFTGKYGVWSVSTVNNKVKDWCGYIGLKGNYGSHSLRKSFGFHQRITFGVDIPTLMVCFNHSSQSETLNYLCVQPEELTKVYQNSL